MSVTAETDEYRTYLRKYLRYLEETYCSKCKERDCTCCGIGSRKQWIRWILGEEETRSHVNS